MEQLEQRPIDSLIPFARNARTHSDEQVAQLAGSIREWGWTNPVLIAADGTIIAGHGRVMAARKLGMSEVPCLVIGRDWSEAKRRAYTIADNRLAESAGWDMDLLRIELQEIGGEFDLDLIGFDTKELDALLAERTDGLTDPDDIPELQDVAVSRHGDVWILGRHRLICGDCTDAATVAKVLSGVKPHLMTTDPPYGVEYDPKWRHRAGVNLSKRTGVVDNDDRADWREAWALFPGDVAYVWHAGLHSTTVADSLIAAGFSIRSQIVWAKDRLVLGRGDYHWQHEPCWYAVRNGAAGHWSGDRKQTTLWHIANKDQDAETVHGTQKPVECMRRPVENNSSPGQAVYEPFSGSGSTIIACEQTGRSCLAIELNPLYVDVAVRRWQAFAGQAAVLDSSGKTFEETERDRKEEAGQAAVQADA